MIFLHVSSSSYAFLLKETSDHPMIFVFVLCWTDKSCRIFEWKRCLKSCSPEKSFRTVSLFPSIFTSIGNCSRERLLFLKIWNLSLFACIKYFLIGFSVNPWNHQDSAKHTYFERVHYFSFCERTSLLVLSLFRFQFVFYNTRSTSNSNFLIALLAGH